MKNLFIALFIIVLVFFAGVFLIIIQQEKERRFGTEQCEKYNFNYIGSSYNNEIICENKIRTAEGYLIKEQIRMVKEW